MKLLFFLAVGFLSCTQPNPTQKIKNKDTFSVSNPDTPVAHQQPPKDATPTYDSSIYSHYISPSVVRLLSQHLPQWHVPDPGSWDAFWFSEYKKDSALVNAISGDFNCDGKQDYCLLLTHVKEGLAVWVLQSAGETYKAIKLEELGHMERPIEVGLLITEAGQLDYLDEKAEEAKAVHINCPAISVVFFEKAAWTYYWEDGKFVEVQTGD